MKAAPVFLCVQADGTGAEAVAKDIAIKHTVCADQKRERFIFSFSA